MVIFVLAYILIVIVALFCELEVNIDKLVVRIVFWLGDIWCVSKEESFPCKAVLYLAFDFTRWYCLYMVTCIMLDNIVDPSGVIWACFWHAVWHSSKAVVNIGT